MPGVHFEAKRKCFVNGGNKPLRGISGFNVSGPFYSEDVERGKIVHEEVAAWINTGDEAHLKHPYSLLTKEVLTEVLHLKPLRAEVPVASHRDGRSGTGADIICQDVDKSKVVIELKTYRNSGPAFDRNMNNIDPKYPKTPDKHSGKPVDNTKINRYLIQLRNTMDMYAHTNRYAEGKMVYGKVLVICNPYCDPDELNPEDRYRVFDESYPFAKDVGVNKRKTISGGVSKAKVESKWALARRKAKSLRKRSPPRSS